MTVDAILERLLADGRVLLDAWPALTLLALGVAGIFAVATRLCFRKRVAELTGRLATSDRRLGKTKSRLAEELKTLEDERQSRLHLEAIVTSLREQLASAQSRLADQRKPAEPAVREAPRRARYDDLFGPGTVIDGRLTKGEAERLLEALQEIADLMNARVGPSRLAAADGPAWWRYVASKGIPHAIELVGVYRRDLIDFANALEAIITRQPDLEFRLRRIVGDVGPIASLLNVAGGYVRSMDRLNDGESYKAAVLTENAIHAGLASLQTTMSDSIGDEVRRG